MTTIQKLVAGEDDTPDVSFGADVAVAVNALIDQGEAIVNGTGIIGGVDAQDIADSVAVVNDSSTQLAKWAFSFNGVKPRFPVMDSPPTITKSPTSGGGTSAVNGSYVNGNTQFNAASTILSFKGSIFVDVTQVAGYPSKIPSHITSTGGVKGGKNAPIRVKFLTDAPKFDVCFLERAFSQFNIIVDGEYAYREKAATLANSGNYRYYTIDFGVNVTTFEKAQTNFGITAGGSGYVVGEVVTLDGGTGSSTGTPASVLVTQVSGGVVTAVDIASAGNYDSQPNGTFNQTSTTGSGSGLQLQANFFGKLHTKRKMRQIEIVYSDPAVFMGVVGTTQDVFLPYPSVTKHRPKLAIISDSIGIGTYLAYGASHIGASAAQQLGLWDDLIISGIGGTGWITGGEQAWSSSARLQDFIDYNADIYLFMGSQNDGGPSTALQNAIRDTINAIQVARPKAYFVGIGNTLGGSVSLANSIQAGFLAANNQDRVRFINNQAPYQWITSLAAGNYIVTGDGNHLSQSGMDYFATITSNNVATALLDMVNIY